MQSCEEILTFAFYMPVTGKILRQIRNISNTKLVWLNCFIHEAIAIKYSGKIYIQFILNLWNPSGKGNSINIFTTRGFCNLRNFIMFLSNCQKCTSQEIWLSEHNIRTTLSVFMGNWETSGMLFKFSIAVSSSINWR